MLEPGSSKRGKLVKNKLIVRFSVADEISFGVIHMCGQSEKGDSGSQIEDVCGRPQWCYNF